MVELLLGGLDHDARLLTESAYRSRRAGRKSVAPHRERQVPGVVPLDQPLLEGGMSSLFQPHQRYMSVCPQIGVTAAKSLGSAVRSSTPPCRPSTHRQADAVGVDVVEPLHLVDCGERIDLPHPWKSVPGGRRGSARSRHRPLASTESGSSHGSMIEVVGTQPWKTISGVLGRVVSAGGTGAGLGSESFRDVRAGQRAVGTHDLVIPDARGPAARSPHSLWPYRCVERLPSADSGIASAVAGTRSILVLKADHPDRSPPARPRQCSL